VAEAPEFRKGFCAFRLSAVGASPSGKAVDFDSTIRRFESSRPSQAFQRSATIPKKREKGPKITAFRAFGFVSKLPIPRFWGANCRKSPATSANIPVLRRLRPETWFDLHCKGRHAAFSTVLSSHLFVKAGVSDRALRGDGGIRFCVLIRFRQKAYQFSAGRFRSCGLWRLVGKILRDLCVELGDEPLQEIAAHAKRDQHLMMISGDLIDFP
jgi:hypothetical protein